MEGASEMRRYYNVTIRVSAVDGASPEEILEELAGMLNAAFDEVAHDDLLAIEEGVPVP